ncbi:hypothetical protein OAG06_00325 [Verrucomicrobia bacterium]|nr:hypothetical protein [Verrucomicrobiota bacterium]
MNITLIKQALLPKIINRSGSFFTIESVFCIPLYSVVFVMIKHGFTQENQEPKTSQPFRRKQASERLERRKSDERDAEGVEELVFGGRDFDRS